MPSISDDGGWEVEVALPLPLPLAPPPSAGASIADPFVLVRLGDGSVRLLCADAADGELTAAEEPPDLTLPSSSGLSTDDPDPVTACCLFTDTDGLLAAAAAAAAATAVTGGSGTPGAPAVEAGGPGACFALLGRLSGSLEVWAVAPWRFIASFPGAAFAPELLLPCVGRSSDSAPPRVLPGGVYIREIAAQSMPAVAFALELSSGAVAVYALPPLPRHTATAAQAPTGLDFSEADGGAEDGAQPPLAFASAARAPLRWVKALGWGGGGAVARAPSEAALLSPSAPWRTYTPRALTPFDNVCGWAGLVVTQPGAQPLLVLPARGGILTALPLVLPTSAAAAIGGCELPGDAALEAPVARPPVLAPLHSRACRDGLLALMPSDERVAASALRCLQVLRPPWPSLPPRPGAPVSAAEEEEGAFVPPRDRLAASYAPRRVPHGSVYDLITQVGGQWEGRRGARPVYDLVTQVGWSMGVENGSSPGTPTLHRPSSTPALQDSLPPPRGEAVVAIAEGQPGSGSGADEGPLDGPAAQRAAAGLVGLSSLTAGGWPAPPAPGVSAGVAEVVPGGCGGVGPAVLQQQLLYATVHKLAFLGQASQARLSVWGGKTWGRGGVKRVESVVCHFAHPLLASSS